MVVNNLGDDEVQKFLGERRVEPTFFGKGTQMGNLYPFALAVGRGHTARRLQLADLLGELESLGQHVNESGIDIVDALTDSGQFREGVLPRVGGQFIVCGHSPTIMHTRSEASRHDRRHPLFRQLQEPQARVNLVFIPRL